MYSLRPLTTVRIIDISATPPATPVVACWTRAALSASTTTGLGVAAGVGVGLTSPAGTSVGSGVVCGVPVGVGLAATVGSGVGVGVAPTGVTVAMGVGAGVWPGLGVGVGVAGLGVGVTGLGVGVGVAGLGVGVLVGTGVGVRQPGPVYPPVQAVIALAVSVSPSTRFTAWRIAPETFAAMFPGTAYTDWSVWLSGAVASVRMRGKLPSAKAPSPTRLRVT